MPGTLCLEEALILFEKLHISNLFIVEMTLPISNQNCKYIIALSSFLPDLLLDLCCMFLQTAQGPSTSRISERKEGSGRENRPRRPCLSL